ncbi:MAG: hypothetical protein WBD40_04620 [Tepidisphaeraceae bacterium]
MLRLKYLAAATVVVLGSTASVASADDGSRFIVKRISAGPRPASYVLVRTHSAADAARPYALTGDVATSSKRSAVRATATHPRGTHDPY